MRRALRVLTLVLAAAACEDVTVHPAVRSISAPIATPSFSRDIAPILEETCASSGACHGGSSPQLGMSLSLGRAYASLVNVPSSTVPGMMRVRPGLPDSSFMFRVLSTDQTYRLGFYRMPLTEVPMPQPVVETIRNWILQGANDN